MSYNWRNGEWEGEGEREGERERRERERMIDLPGQEIQLGKVH